MFAESSMYAKTPTIKEETYTCNYCHQHMADEFSLKVGCSKLFETVSPNIMMDVEHGITVFPHLKIKPTWN